MEVELEPGHFALVPLGPEGADLALGKVEVVRGPQPMPVVDQEEPSVPVVALEVQPKCVVVLDGLLQHVVTWEEQMRHVVALGEQVEQQVDPGCWAGTA